MEHNDTNQTDGKKKQYQTQAHYKTHIKSKENPMHMKTAPPQKRIYSTTTNEARSMLNNAGKIKDQTIYNRFKMVATYHNISQRKALDEAIRMWLDANDRQA